MKMSDGNEGLEMNTVTAPASTSEVRGAYEKLFHAGFVRFISEKHISILEKILSGKQGTSKLRNETEIIEYPSPVEQFDASMALQIACSCGLDIFNSIKITPNEKGKEVTLSSTDIEGLANLRITKLLDQPVIWLKPIDLTPAVEPFSKVRIESTRITRKCMLCAKILKPYPSSSILFWRTMEFCNYTCLIKFQTSRFGGKCSYCKMNIIFQNYGMFGVSFGMDFILFCSQLCFMLHRSHTTLCSYCELVISNNPQTKKIIFDVFENAFCSTICSEKYKKKFVTKDLCHKCRSGKKGKLTIKTQNRKYKFCSKSCFVAFKLLYEDPVTKVLDCVVCRKIYGSNEYFENFSIFVNSRVVNICSALCHKFYIITHRKIITCQSCLIKKYNTDMIRRTFPGGVELTICSVHCLMKTIIREELPDEAKMFCRYCKERFTSIYWYLTIDQTDAFCSKFCIDKWLQSINGLAFIEPCLDSDTNDNSTSSSGSSSSYSSSMFRDPAVTL